ncbi:DUF6578 domain-containing protein [Microbacterium sp.]|uniref:DUF6578 domain-containing protein n=1 Tax=Microbacterium sp. TaxID=51671 RepID=UPI003F72FE5C
MRVEITVGGWEHDCCGPEIERYQRVRWTCVTNPDGGLVETHHGLEGFKTTDVIGTIVDIELLNPDGSRVLITRVPSGRALRGFDELDDGELFEMYSDQPANATGRELADPEFIVTLEVDR